MNELREQVRRHYADAAVAAQHPRPSTDCCGGASSCASSEDRLGGALYGAEAAEVDGEVVAASLGCGVPTAVADLHPGEVVLDLGSGAGLDVIVSARRVGPTGTAYGLDMTDEMLALARRNAEVAGVTNATFLEGYIEDIPLPDAAVDVVVSNCVINLSTDKASVFAELARVVRPAGRLAISDIVADDDLTPAQRAERGSYVGCIAGALSEGEYRQALHANGFSQIEIVLTHQVTEGMHAAIVRAVRA